MVKMRATIQRNTLQDRQDCIISLNLGVSMFSNVNAKKPIMPCMAVFVSSSPSETNSCVPPADRLKLPYKINPAKRRIGTAINNLEYFNLRNSDFNWLNIFATYKVQIMIAYNLLFIIRHNQYNLKTREHLTKPSYSYMVIPTDKKQWIFIFYIYFSCFAPFMCSAISKIATTKDATHIGIQYRLKQQPYSSNISNLPNTQKHMTKYMLLSPLTPDNVL